MVELGITYYLILSALLFVSGLFVILTRKNLIFILLGVELMINAGNLLLVIASKYQGGLDGQVMVIFSLVLTVCEVAIALAIIFNIHKKYRNASVDALDKVGNE